MKIGFILECVDNGTLVLPEFQRGYVWSRDQVKGLMQSLYHGYPVGGLLIWQTRADTTNLRGAEAAGADVVKLLLDGQQRITSLYGLIRGRSPQFMEDPERANAFTGLHFHLGQESFEFYQPSKMAGDPLWISVTDLMLHGPETVTEALGDVESMSAKTLVSYVNRLQHLYGVRDVEFHDESISGDDMTVDVVVDIFNRVNSGGTKLSKGDLALARICALRSTAREELRAAVARWRSAGFEFTLDWLLRCVNAVMTGEAKFDALKSVSAEDFGLGLKRTEHAVDFVLNLLATRLGVDHDRVLIGRYGIPAMVRLVVDHGGSLTNTQQQNDLLYWFIHQAAWGRYSGSTETVLDRDLAAIETGGVEGLIRELSLWRGSLVVRPEDFETQTVSSRFYPVLYMLTRVNDASDFCSGLPLSSHLLGKGSQLEVHHLFPKGILYAAGYERKDVNAVANFAFLTGECNRKLGMTASTEYFPRVEKAHPGVLASQWITSDSRLWQVENYPEFLADRRTRLASAANALLDGLRAGTRPDDVRGTAAEVVEEPDRDDRLGSLSDWCASLGLARPEVPAEITDPDTGEALVYADAAWSEGMQVGRTEKVALLLTPDEETEARLGELGRFRRPLRSRVGCGPRRDAVAQHGVGGDVGLRTAQYLGESVPGGERLGCFGGPRLALVIGDEIVENDIGVVGATAPGQSHVQMVGQQAQVGQQVAALGGGALGPVHGGGVAEPDVVGHVLGRQTQRAAMIQMRDGEGPVGADGVHGPSVAVEHPAAVVGHLAAVGGGGEHHVTDTDELIPDDQAAGLHCARWPPGGHGPGH